MTMMRNKGSSKSKVLEDLERKEENKNSNSGI